MNYSMVFCGKKVQLPKFTLTIADKFDEVEKLNPTTPTVREKICNLYRFFEDVLGTDMTKDLLGELDDIDPNLVNLLYLNMVTVYNEPVNSYHRKQAEKDYNTTQIQQLTEFVKALTDANIDFQNGMPVKKVNND